MAMEWKNYSQTKPHKPDWYLVWVSDTRYQAGYADIDYWDGTKWEVNRTSINWWFEIKPPPSNNKQVEQ